MDLIFGLLERMIHTRHIDLKMMIIVVQRQHGGSLLGLVWGSRITLFDSLSIFIYERGGYDFQKFTLGISCVDSWEIGRVSCYFQELIHMEN
jgi:hypothetical protein